jgi:glycosyltransferase involved in cell wall biosynthesis
VKRILIIQPWIRLGGAELVSVHFADAAQRAGNDVAIACCFVDRAGMPPQAYGVAYRLPPMGLANALAKSRVLFLLFGPWILLWLVWRHSRGVDVLNPHEFPGTWIAVLVGAIRRIPVVWSSYGPTRRFSWREVGNIRLADWLGWRVASSSIDRMFVRRLHAIHVPSILSQDQIRERYQRQAEVIPLGVDFKFYSAGSSAHVAQKYDLADRLALLCVGKLHPQENHALCLQAMPHVLAFSPEALLLVAGDGPMLGRLKEITHELGIEEHVKFVGHVASWEIRDLYRACSLHLFPAVDESWGMTPFEALCAGCPSIVSRETGAAELMAEHSIGTVCAPTPLDFANSIRDFFDAPQSFTDNAKRGSDYVAGRLTWDRYGSHVMELMRAVLEPSTSRIGSVEEVLQ